MQSLAISNNQQPSLGAKQREQRARAHIQAHKDSNLSVTQYCSQYHLSESTFYGWLKRYSLVTEDILTPVLPSYHKRAVTTKTLAEQGLRIELPQGIVIHLDAINDMSCIIGFIKEMMSWS
mgnify:CR=1 FL=1